MSGQGHLTLLDTDIVKFFEMHNTHIIVPAASSTGLPIIFKIIQKQLSFLPFAERTVCPQRTGPTEPASQAEWKEVEISGAVD